MSDVGIGIARQIIDNDGDAITTTNRLPVETEQDDPFGTFVTYPAFEVRIDSQNLVHADHADADIEDAKEILIQTDDANTSYVMVGSSSILTVADATPSSRRGIKLNGGETLVLAIGYFSKIFLDAEDSGDGTSNQIVNVAYFK